MPKRRDIEGLGRLAARQAGRVTRAQLHLMGFSDATIDDWTRRGLLIRRLPKVYALGHAAPSQEARLWEAVLYAGPGAMLSHLTAAQWCGYITYAPVAIHVSTPRKIASLPNLVVHGRRQLERRTHKGIPVTTVPQTMLDLATVRSDLLERALGQLEYLQDVGLDALGPATDSTKPGCAVLRQAVIDYDPGFARLNDAFEIDGRQNHHTAGQLLRDAERDLICRELGLTIIRYRRAQITRTPDRVRHDLETQLARRTPSQSTS